ncbi:MAG: hypothetical protein VB064_12410 [Oscillospiraceae bacterium]|nr:hypothetical protein [Oscillospiraceae bacterium]
MADMNDLKGKFLNTLGTVAGKTRGYAEKAADKARDVARIAKLNMELGAEKDTIEKAYLEIGKLYYETRKNAPDGFFVQLCDEITLANDNISKILSELDDLRAGLGSKDCDIEVEFTEVTVDKPDEKAVSEDDFAKEGSDGEDIPERSEEERSE